MTEETIKKFVVHFNSFPTSLLLLRRRRNIYMELKEKETGEKEKFKILISLRYYGCLIMSLCAKVFIPLPGHNDARQTERAAELLTEAHNLLLT